MAEATVNIAIEILSDLLAKEAKLLSGVSHEIEELKAQLERMKSFLHEADKKQYESEIIRTLVKQTKRVAYKFEDVIEEFSIQVSSKRRRCILKRFACILSECDALHKVGMKIAEVKTTITNLTASFRTIGIPSHIEDKRDKNNWRRQTYPDEVEQNLIEMKDEIKSLVSRLVVNEYQKEGIISIWGMGGSGKTTLARKIYHHHEIKPCFNAFAWVCITHECETRSVMQEMLRKLAPEMKDKIKEMEDRELVEQLKQVQTEKKCLVVLDDIWKIEDWRDLEQCFPNGEGKILLTTRNKNVAEIGFEHQIRCLTEDEGWELLENRAFPHGNANAEAMERCTMKERITKRRAEFERAQKHTLAEASSSSSHPSKRSKESDPSPEVNKSLPGPIDAAISHSPSFTPPSSFTPHLSSPAPAQVIPDTDTAFQPAITQITTLLQGLASHAQKSFERIAALESVNLALTSQTKRSSERIATLEKTQEENLACISCLKSEVSLQRSNVESCLKRIEDLTSQNKVLKEEKLKAEGLLEESKTEQHVVARRAVREFRQSEAGQSWVEERALEWFTTGFTRCKAQFQSSGMFPPETDLSFIIMDKEMPDEYTAPPFDPGLSDNEAS